MPSPRTYQADKLNIKDIGGAQTSTFKLAKKFSVRDHINVNDIIEEGKGPFRYGVTSIPDKNGSILSDDVIGRKKHYSKGENSPLDPKYLVSTKSKRMIILGEVEGGKPKQFVKPQFRKDTKRYMRVDDIQGASPKERALLPESTLPGLHPMFQDRNDVRKELREIAVANKQKAVMSKGMAEALTREHLHTDDQSRLSESPNKATSKYKQIHDKWLMTKENNSRLPAPVSDQQFYIDQIQGKVS